MSEPHGRPQHPHVTLDAVARTAGVSPATASRALNGTTRVRDDLLRRVRAAADELGYIPNAHAQALASASNNTVGVICHDVGDPYFAAIASGIMARAAEAGLLVMLSSTFRAPEREIAYISMLRAQRARAILLIGSGFQDPAWERSLESEIAPYLRGGGRVAVVCGTAVCASTPYCRRTGRGPRRSPAPCSASGTGSSGCSPGPHG